MPYLKIVKKAHECHKPSSVYGHRGSRGVYIGTVWACPKCSKQWIIDEDAAGKLYWRTAKVEEQINK
jgi:hypothetical protein